VVLLTTSENWENLQIDSPVTRVLAVVGVRRVIGFGGVSF
jgi:hypothetical protein